MGRSIRYGPEKVAEGVSARVKNLFMVCSVSSRSVSEK